MIFLPLETELFYYEHLLDSSDNLQLIQDFCVTNTSGYGLERYIKELAESDEKDGSARTYLRTSWYFVFYMIFYILTRITYNNLFLNRLLQVIIGTEIKF